jgi:hypothetical protein
MSDLPEPGFSTELSTNAVDMPETWRLLLAVAGIAIQLSLLAPPEPVSRPRGRRP